MRNLKRVLALVLALTMVLSFAISASAGAFTDVKDGDDYASAINLLASLEVLKGFEDGTYNSAGSYTREQFAKILYVLVNGKDDNAAMYQGAAPFPDVEADRWSAGYITWAVNLGICNGRDDGNFWPTDVVKYAEACKMFLIAMGYSSTIYTYPYGFIDKASTLKMFDDIQGYTTFGDANRGTVAQMAYNALFAEAPRFGTYTAKEGETTTTAVKLLIMGAFGVTYDYGILNGTSTNAYNTGVYGENQIDVSYYSVIKDKDEVITNRYGLNGTFNYTGDVDDLIGMTAKLWYKTDEDALGNMKIYLVEDSNKDKAYEVNPYDVADIDDSSASEVAFKDANGATRRLKVDANQATIKWDGKPGTAIADGTSFTDKTVTYKVIDRGNDGKIDAIYEIQPDAAKITALSDTRISVSAGELVGSNSIKSGDDTVINVFDGAAKDDRVLVYAKKAVVGNAIKTVYDVVKAESVDNAKFTAQTKDAFYFGGNKYELTGTAGEPKRGDTYNLYLNANGYVYEIDKVDTEADGNWILVTDADNSFRNVGDSDKLRATTITGYLADGTKKSLSIDFDEVEEVGIEDDADKYFDQTDGWKGEGLPEADYLVFSYTLGDNGMIDSLKPLQAGKNDITDVALTKTAQATYDDDTTILSDDGKAAKGFITSSSVIYHVYKENDNEKFVVLKNTDLPEIKASGGVSYAQMGLDGGNVAVVVLYKDAKIGASSDKYALLIDATENIVSSSKVNYSIKAAVDGEITTLTTKDVSVDGADGISDALLVEAGENGDTPVIGYAKLTINAAGNISEIQLLDNSVEPKKEGETSFVSGAVSAIPNTKGVGIRTATYDTKEIDDEVTKTFVKTVADDETVYVYDSNVAFYTVGRAPYEAGDLSTKKNVAFKNTSSVNAAAAGSLLKSTLTSDIATTVDSGDTVYGVDLIYKQDSATKGDNVVVAVFIYTTPVSGPQGGWN